MAKDMVRLGVTLLLICGIAGLGLAAVYGQTYPVIEQRAKDDLIAAAKSAIPGADTIVEETKDGVTYWVGTSGGKLAGAAVKVDAKGFNSSEPIQMMVGVDGSGVVAGVAIVSINETPGVGMKVKDKAFLARFVGVSDPNAVDGISNATVSSRAVKGGVSEAVRFLSAIVAPKAAKPLDITKIVDGIYRGTGQGFMGPIEVSVTVAGGKVTGVAVVSHKETAGVADSALIKVPQSIVAQQKVEVDTVSGATYASRGVIEAVRNALAGAQAK